jgi:hypothetical protein
VYTARALVSPPSPALARALAFSKQRELPPSLSSPRTKPHRGPRHGECHTPLIWELCARRSRPAAFRGERSWLARERDAGKREAKEGGEESKTPLPPPKNADHPPEAPGRSRAQFGARPRDIVPVAWPGPRGGRPGAPVCREEKKEALRRERGESREQGAALHQSVFCPRSSSLALSSARLLDLARLPSSRADPCRPSKVRARRGRARERTRRLPPQLFLAAALPRPQDARRRRLLPHL